MVVICLFLLPAESMASAIDDEAEAYFEEGMALNKQRQFNDAIIQFSEAIKLRIDKHKYHRGLHQTYLATRRVRQGLNYYKSLLRDRPKNATVHYWLGRYHLANQDLESSAREFQKASVLDPEEEHAFIALGQAYARLGKMDESLDAFLAADQLVPDVAVVKIGIGNAYFAKKEFDKAEKAYKRGLEKDSSFLEARFNLGVIYEQKGEYGEAGEQWGLMIEADPNESEARERLAQLYMRGKLYIDAVREYSTLSLVNLHNPRIFLALGEAQVLLASELSDAEDRKQLRKLAKESFKRVIELEAQNKKARRYLKQLEKISALKGEK